jgi:hypothetical protein
MQLMVSRSYPVIDAQTLAEYVARDALFRTADGPICCTWRRGDRLSPKSASFFSIVGTPCFGSTRRPTRAGHIGISAKARGGVVVRKTLPR